MRVTEHIVRWELRPWHGLNGVMAGLIRTSTHPWFACRLLAWPGTGMCHVPSARSEAATLLEAGAGR
jgi:hypothetical protein